MNREILRNKAKKMYKENIKNVAKNQRISFNEFFKRYRESLKNKSSDIVETEGQEDFDLEQVANVNEVTEKKG